MASATNPPQFESHQQHPYITFPSPTPSTTGPPPLPPVNSSASASAAAASSSSCTRKVQVIYVLARRSGQIEHPHLLEVCIPPNEGLYLRDVKKRLAMIRGKRLPSAFAWSYKRSYKTGYVWQDLCDDDLIFPAHGCEYVLKGSEILENEGDMAEVQCNHNNSTVASKDKTSSSSGSMQGVNPKAMSDRGLDNDIASVSLSSLQINSMVDAGTDAATQTEEELQAPSSSASNLIHQRQHLHNPKAVYNMQNRELPDRMHNQTLVSNAGAAITAGRTNEHFTELNKNDINSPPSISSLSNAPSPYNNLTTGSNRSSPDGDAVTEHNIGNGDVINDDSGPSNDENLTGSCKTPGRTWTSAGRSKEEQRLAAEEMMMANQKGATGDSPKVDMAMKAKYNSLGSVVSGNMQDSDPGYGNLINTHPGRTGKSKSGALSLLQLMSCGSLDIKEQILPMSLYQLRSKATIAGHEGMVSADRLTEVFDYGISDQNPQQLKSWSSLSKPGAEGTINSNYGNLKSCSIVSDEYGSYGEEPEPTHNIQPTDTVASSPANNHGIKSQSVKNGSKPVPRSSRFESNGQQDVISIGRSSISDRSLNGSRELQDYAQNLGNGGTVIRSINGRELSRSTEFNRGSINSNGHVIISSNQGSPSVMNSNSSGPRPLGAMLKSVSGEVNMKPPSASTARKHYSTSGILIMHEHQQRDVGTTKSALDHNVQQIDDDEVEIINSSSINNNNNNNDVNDQSTRAGGAISDQSQMWRSHQLQYQQQQQQQQHQQYYSNSSISVRGNRLANNNNMISRSGPAMDQFKYSPNNALVYDRSMAQLWEELLAAPAAAKKAASVCNGSTNGVAKIEIGDIYNNQNLRRLQQALSNADLERERTLQNAVDLSLPSVEHLITLHECPHCGRKVKPEHMKSHMKNCNSPKPNKSNSNNNNNTSIPTTTINTNNNSINNNSNKGGKQESILCQRLFRASPPPTK